MTATRVVLLSLLLAPSLAHGQGFALKDGDHVVFFGDDITEDGQYARAVEEYVATRFPAWNVDFFYAGVSGDRVGGGGAAPIAARLDRDVIAAHANVVMIMLGMNDGGYRPFDQALLDLYGQGYRRILGRLAEALPGARLMPLGPSPFDDVTRPPVFADGYNAVLRRYGKLVEEVAKERGANFVDLGAPLQTGLEKVNKVSPTLARMIIPDRVHPAPPGHWVMAAALLRAQVSTPGATRPPAPPGGRGQGPKVRGNRDRPGGPRRPAPPRPEGPGPPPPAPLRSATVVPPPLKHGFPRPRPSGGPAPSS